MSSEHDHHQRNTGDRNGALILLAFIVLLIFKAAGYDLSWWFVTSPLWLAAIYLILHDLFR